MSLVSIGSVNKISSIKASMKSLLKRAGVQWLLVKFQRIPKDVSVELTNDCNLRCAKCPTYEADRGKGFMSPELFYKILNDIKESGGKTVLTFTGGGEATLNPKLLEFTVAAKKVKNIRAVRLITNGLGLNEDLIRGLIAAGIDEISVSLDTTEREVYKKINQVDGFDQVIRNINALDEARRGVKLKTQMKVTLYKNDMEEVGKMKNMFGSKFDTVRFTGMHKWLGLRGKQQAVKPTEPCPYPFFQTQILWNGQITLCCNDSMEGYINMGSINDFTLSDYWRKNEKLRAVRLAHIKGDLKTLPVCESCDIHMYVRDKKL